MTEFSVFQNELKGRNGSHSWQNGSSNRELNNEIIYEETADFWLYFSRNVYVFQDFFEDSWWILDGFFGHPEISRNEKIAIDFEAVEAKSAPMKGALNISDWQSDLKDNTIVTTWETRIFDS